MDHILQDERFKHIAKDPKYRPMPRWERKVKIDKRFQSMFNDKRFMVKSTIDKRGRPIGQSSSENLRKYYDLSSDEESDTNEEEAEKNNKRILTTKQKKIKDEGEDAVGEENSSDNDFSSNGELLRIKPKEQQDNLDEDNDTSSQEDNDSSDDSQEDTQHHQDDLVENERQLRLRQKGEITKVSGKVKEKLQDLSINYARGEGVLVSDSSSDEESSESEDEVEIEHKWGELDKEAETTDEVTHRLAVCNMDWDRIRAVDLMVLLNSFLPSGGLIKSVTIYPSEFGMQRMKEEEVSGPIELTQPNDNDLEEDDDQEEGSEYHMEKLRQYQLNRLKYYYAVVDFDSTETANKVYTECDGIEYESTATKLDLRFIPDDMEFDQEPRETCNEIPELAKYQPRQFTTTALQQVKVELTWDETNPERQEFAQKVNSGKLDEINESDLQAYLGSDTSESDSEPEKKEDRNVDDDSDSETADPIAKYKSLLKEIEDQEEAKQKKEVELEFTWGLGTEQKAEKLVKERLKKNEDLTPFEQYLEKRKAKKKAKREERKKLKTDGENDNNDSDVSESEGDEDSNMKKMNGKSSKRKNAEGKKSNSDDEDEDRRKAELELLLMDENGDENKRHFNMKKIEETATMSKSKQKRLNKKKTAGDEQPVDDFEVDVKDPRFNALFTSHHFNIDPADPHYRKTKGTDALVKEKLKRRVDTDTTEGVKPKQQKKDKKLNAELQALVKSVKRNTQNITRPIKR